MGTPRPLFRRRSAGGTLRPARPGVLGLLLVVLLAACGGGSGGGGGGDNGPGPQLQVMLINLSKTPATATSTSGGDPQTVDACKFDEVDFPLADPFTLNINDQPALDSSTIAGGVPGGGQSFVLMELTIGKDGTPEVTTKPYVGRAGGLSRPSALFVTGSCAK